jgi:hypothetical protein
MRFPVLLIACSFITACGNDTPAPAAEQDTRAEAKEVEPPPLPEPKADVPAGDEAFEDDWGSEGGAEEGEPAAEEGGEEAGGEDAAVLDPFPGPCRITWSTGAVLRFKYADNGGSVQVDEDGNKKADVCGTFETKDGKTTTMTIDEGCNKKDTFSITPKYDDKSNVATASAKDGELTLVTIPGYTGLTPGYPLYAERKAAGVKVSKGLVKSADVKEPWQGPPMKVTFTYDKEGRVTRIKEDHDRDRSTDRRFDYRYDKAGNVTRVNVQIGSGEAQQKGKATLNYACHNAK